jgi:hypothetical protein
MRKITLAVVLATLSFSSFAEFSLNCPEIYARLVSHKNEQRDKAGRVGDQIGKAALVSAFVNPIISGSLFVPVIGIRIFEMTSSKEDRVQMLMEDGTGQLRRLTKKMQKRISSDITSEEISGIIKEGLESGQYCMDFPDIYSPKDVKKHVEEVLKEKYASKQ